MLLLIKTNNGIRWLSLSLSLILINTVLVSKIILEIKLMLQHLNKYNFLNCFENYTFEYFFSANLETLTYLYFMYFVEYFKEIISTQVIRVCQNITT